MDELIELDLLKMFVIYLIVQFLFEDSMMMNVNMITYENNLVNDEDDDTFL